MLVFAGLWIAVITFGQVATGTVALPLLGPVPTPLLLLAAGMIAGFILAKLLGAHAHWLGRRWTGRIRRSVVAELDSRLALAGFAPLDALDAARERLATAHAIARDC